MWRLPGLGMIHMHVLRNKQCLYLLITFDLIWDAWKDGCVPWTSLINLLTIWIIERLLVIYYKKIYSVWKVLSIPPQSPFPEVSNPYGVPRPMKGIIIIMVLTVPSTTGRSLCIKHFSLRNLGCSGQRFVNDCKCKISHIVVAERWLDPPPLEISNCTPKSTTDSVGAILLT